MEKLVAHNAAKEVTYGWDCSTSHGDGVDRAPIDLLDDFYEKDKFEEDDPKVSIHINDSVEEMVTDDTNDADDTEADQHNEDMYPPPLEYPEVIMKKGKRKELSTEKSLNNFLAFGKKFHLISSQLYYHPSRRSRSCYGGIIIYQSYQMWF